MRSHGVCSPFRHPISGKAVGAVNLTSWHQDAGRLLIALAQSTACQVTQGLLYDSSAGELQLLREHLRACRHTGGFVFALTHDMVLMNDQARDTLSGDDGTRPSAAPQVIRSEILSSWRRSKLCGVAPAGSELPFRPDITGVGRLLQAARPVLDHLAGRCHADHRG